MVTTTHHLPPGITASRPRLILAVVLALLFLAAASMTATLAFTGANPVHPIASGSPGSGGSGSGNPGGPKP